MYIQKDRRTAVDESILAVSTVSELAYEMSVFILNMWNQNPNEHTLEQLANELIVDPKHSKFVNTLRAPLSANFTVDMIYTACRMAYDEFNQRIGRLYRAVQCRENGDIPGYAEAMAPLLSKLGNEIQKEVAGQLILPGGK